jgi:hypothetical protein
MNLQQGILLVCSVSAVGLFAAGGCGPVSSGIEGVTCTQDSDCNPGLKCLAYEGFAEASAEGGDEGGVGPSCANGGNECLVPCHTNDDCNAAAAGLICFTSCGASACEAPGYLGVPLVEAGGDGEAGGDAEAGAESSVGTVDAPNDAVGQ